MAEMEDKLGAILNNPQLMQQIMSMAQSLGNQQQSPPQQPAPSGAAPSLPDPSMLQTLSALAADSGTDSQQQALLSALSPYLHSDRLYRLEKAMRAAKMAKLASSLLGSGVLQSLTGR